LIHIKTILFFANILHGKLEVNIMNVFSELFNDLTGWLTVGIIIFMLVMMAYLFSMFINQSAGDDR